jgi:dTDP-4-dehydrorhamnose reductase
MQRILVTGGNGLLACQLRKMAPGHGQFFFLGHAEFDLLDAGLMARRLAELQPRVVINTAAYNLVDRCETERDLSWAVNAAAPQKLAELCAEQNIRLVHYSTDYVFDGAKKSPYTEADAPRPLNHYAAGKLAGEQAVLRASPAHLVLRTSWVFDWHPVQAKTFIHTLLKMAREGRPLKAATDQASVPTYASDLAEWTLALVRGGAGGLFHAVNDDGLSRFDWASGILAAAAEMKLIPAVPVLEPVLSSYFNAAMRRPDYTVLSNEKLARQLGRPAGSWRPGLRKMLAQMK